MIVKNIKIVYCSILVFCTFVFPFFLMLSPQVAAAADPYTYVPLEPIPGLTKAQGTCDTTQPFSVRKNDPKCQADIINYIPNAIKLTIAIAGALAVLMIVIGGFEYITAASIGGKSGGKDKINNALFGLLLALSSYVILNSINPAILKFNLSLSPILNSGTTNQTPSTGGIPTNPSPCPAGQVQQPDGSCVTPTPSQSVGDLNGRPWPSSWIGGSPSPSEVDVLQQFASYPISTTVNKSNCSTVGDSGCTSLDGLSASALSGLRYLATACAQSSCKSSGGVIVVTAGTEFWLHGKYIKTDPSSNPTAHRPGGGAVDISKGSNALNNLIMSGGVISGATGCSTGLYYKFNGVVYVDEQIVGNPPHWHVCY